MITGYEIFDGITLLYNDFHMEFWEGNKRNIENVVEINHCREGRFECEFKDGTCAYLEVNNLAVNMLTNKPKNSCFPLQHYHGISILLELDIAQNAVNAILEDPPNLKALAVRLCGDNICRIIRETEPIQHIFSELYTVPENIKLNYMRLKVMELILFLINVRETELTENRYFRHDKVTKIKAVRKFITENPEKHYTLEELAQRFDLSVSALKTCFKGVYNQSVYAFLKGYRLDLAETLLRTTDIEIAEIALSVGYSNPSKFSAAFLAHCGSSPSEYRKNNRMD